MDILQQILLFQQQDIPIRLRDKRTTEVYNKIVLLTKFLPDTAKIKERIYCIMNNITSIPACKYCNNPTKFLGPSTGYRDFCSVKCSSNSDEKKSMIVRTNLEKYGTKTPVESDMVKQKYFSTLDEKYGKGIRSTQQIAEIRNKTKQTNLQKYGSEWYTNSDIGKVQITRSHFIRYKHNRFTQTNQYKNRFRATCKRLYDRLHHKQFHISHEVLDNINNPNWIIDQHHNKQKPILQIAQENGVGATLIHRKLKQFNIEQKYFYSSIGEGELIEFIKLHYTNDIILRSKKIIPPYELDIYLPDIKLAIEYDGIYWHSENQGKDRSYHITKHNKCNQQNIQLINIYDVEWNNNRTIVESRLLHKLKNNNQSVYARSCYIRPLTNLEAKEFTQANHIQGSIYASIRLGLYYNDILYAVMTFGISRYDRNFQYELIRYSTLCGYNVVGGASKLFKYFVNTYDPISVVSYCDKRWGNGTVYYKIGMTLITHTPPNYHYFKPSQLKLLSRQQFQKHKLEDKLDTVDIELTEWENMQSNGYYRIWDCGQLKFAWIKEDSKNVQFTTEC